MCASLRSKVIHGTGGHTHNLRFVELRVGEGEANELVLTERLYDFVFNWRESWLLGDEVHVEIAEVLF